MKYFFKILKSNVEDTGSLWSVIGFSKQGWFQLHCIATMYIGSVTQYEGMDHIYEKNIFYNF